MQAIDGNKIAKKILEQCAAAAGELPLAPKIVDIVVGDDPVSLSYVKIKSKKAKVVGADFQLVQLPASSTTETAVRKIRELNQIRSLCGLIIQLPLPAGVDKKAVLDAIDSQIDIDCLGSENSALFYSGHGGLVPPTAAAILAILDSVAPDLTRKEILIIGQGDLVGRPVSFMLKQKGLRVRVVGQSTKELFLLTKNADVIVSGTGHPRLLTGAMLKDGCIVIDAGTAEAGGNIVGDADFDSVSKVASFLTPVPGGVGPVTVAMLYRNLMEAARKRLLPDQKGN